MKVMTIIGTRPEIIRLNVIIRKLDAICDHVLVHTGQNYDYNLNELFMQQLDVRKPDYFLEAKGSFGEQIGIILSKMEKVLLNEKPDRFLVLGDTNSSMAAIIAKRLGISVYHMEAGNRCHDDRVPEEVNRRIIDHSSDILMPYTQRSRENLLQEGIPGRRIYVTGNPIKEVIEYFDVQIQNSDILKTLNLKKHAYFLVTLHRQENVDNPKRFTKFLSMPFPRLEKKYKFPVICSTHPRTRKRLKEFSMESDDITFLDPQGFFEFVHLELNAACVMSDSGTVQEECAIFKVPNVTLRDVTERPETLDVGSNILVGNDPEKIIECVDLVMERESDWTPPEEYLVTNVSDTVLKIVTGYYQKFKEYI